MKSTPPTHEEISRHAEKIWHDRGRPSGCDPEIWLEAERQLAGHAAETKAPAPSPDDLAAKAALQAKAARAPQQQHGKNAPKPAPPESGKPLWDKPHSS